MINKVAEHYLSHDVLLVLFGNFCVAPWIILLEEIDVCWFANNLLPNGKYKVQVRFAVISVAVLICVSNQQSAPAADIFEAWRNTSLSVLS